MTSWIKQSLSAFPRPLLELVHELAQVSNDIAIAFLCSVPVRVRLDTERYDRVKSLLKNPRVQDRVNDSICDPQNEKTCCSLHGRIMKEIPTEIKRTSGSIVTKWLHMQLCPMSIDQWLSLEIPDKSAAEVTMRQLQTSCLESANSADEVEGVPASAGKRYVNFKNSAAQRTLKQAARARGTSL